MLSCGNKVSPASLLTLGDQNSSSAELGHASGLESQQSQVSLFSGSEIPSSLELFSQPMNQADAEPVSSQSVTKPSAADGHCKMNARGGKYYMKYLSSHSLADKQSECTGGGASVPNDDTNSISSKVQFDMWKDKQQDQLERKRILSDVASMHQIVIELHTAVIGLREDIKMSTDRSTAVGENSSQREKHLLSLFTQLLQGQEEAKQTMSILQNELSQQKNMLMSFSNQLSSMVTRDTTDCLSVVTDKIIRGVSTTLQHNPVSTSTVETQTTFDLPETSNIRSSDASDQAVPVGVFVPCTVAGDLCTKLSFLQATCPSDKLESSQTAPEKPMHNVVTDHSHCLQDQPSLKTPEQTCLPSLAKTSVKIEPDDAANCTVLGKRRCNGQNPAMQQTLSKSSKKTKHKVKATNTATDTALPRRRSSRLRKPLKYTQDCFSSGNENSSDCFVLGETKIKRKVSQQRNTRSSRENVESPVNALSEALYSDTSLELLSGVISNSQNLPPAKNVQAKFHRRNEAAKRRKMVISNLTDPELLLRELQDHIINACDPSP